MYNDYWQSIIISSIKSTNKVKLVLFSKYFFENEIFNFYCFPSIEKDQNVIISGKILDCRIIRMIFLWLWTFFFLIKMTILLCFLYLDLIRIHKGHSSAH
mgnify:CR=1 FL=1